MQGGATQADAQAGKKVWTKAGCGNCHTLVAAGSKGTTGPNLDEHMKEEREQGDDILAHVVKRVRNGGGGMPAFEGRLTEREIRDVAAFVHQATMR